jgi:hypothetical protein
MYVLEGSNFEWFSVTRYDHQKIIDTLTGEKGRRSGRGLKSVTQDLEASRILDHERYGSRIVLVDTPGFDHTNRSNEYVLKLTGEWLKKTYVESNPHVPYHPIAMHRYEKRILSGIVYVQRITDPRMSTTNYRNLLMFAELPARRIAKNVVLATTMWDELNPEFDDGNEREQAWKEEYWNDMIPHGATVERFLNDPESAWNIIDNVVNRNKNDQKTTFNFQEQAVGPATASPENDESVYCVRATSN